MKMMIIFTSLEKLPFYFEKIEKRGDFAGKMSSDSSIDRDLPELTVGGKGMRVKGLRFRDEDLSFKQGLSLDFEELVLVA